MRLLGLIAVIVMVGFGTFLLVHNPAPGMLSLIGGILLALGAVGACAASAKLTDGKENNRNAKEDDLKFN